jgi:hypothetical protein
MNRIQWLAMGLALSLIFAGVGGANLAQERPGKPQDGPRTSIIDDLWRQMGQLQKQIVGLEFAEAKPRATPRFEPFPGNIAQVSPTNASQKASGPKSGDIQTPEPAQKTVPAQEPQPKLRDSTSEPQIDQLWRQIAELQKAILKLEIADMNPRLLASAATAANGADRTEKTDTASARNPDRTSGNGPNRETSQKTIRGQQRPLEPRGPSNEAQIGHLWQQIGQLYKQIVTLEVRDTGSY